MIHAAFIAAIRADPTDTSRLVYADFLSENGEDKAGELIRTMCELERLGHPRLESDCEPFSHGENYWTINRYGLQVGRRVDVWKDQRRKRKTHHGLLVTKMTDDGFEAVVKKDSLSIPVPPELVQRQAELLSREWELFPFMRLKSEIGWDFGDGRLCCDYPHPCDCMANAAEIVWRHGLVEEIVCSWEDWRDHGDDVLKRHPVRQVTLTTMPEARTTRTGRHKSGRHRIRLEGRRWHDCKVIADMIGAVYDWSISSRDSQHLNALVHTEWPGIKFVLPERANT